LSIADVAPGTRLGSHESPTPEHAQSTSRHGRSAKSTARRICSADTDSPPGAERPLPGAGDTVRYRRAQTYIEDAGWVSRGCAFVNAAAELPRDHIAYDVIREHKQAVRERLAELAAEDLAACADRDDARRTAEHLFLLAEGAIVHRGLDDSAEPMDTARSIARELLS